MLPGLTRSHLRGWTSAQRLGRPRPPPAGPKPRLARSPSAGVGGGLLQPRRASQQRGPRGTGPGRDFTWRFATRPCARGRRGPVLSAGRSARLTSALSGARGGGACRSVSSSDWPRPLAARCGGRTTGHPDQAARSSHLPCRARRRSRWPTRVLWSTWRPCRSSRVW